LDSGAAYNTTAVLILKGFYERADHGLLVATLIPSGEEVELLLYDKEGRVPVVDEVLRKPAGSPLAQAANESWTLVSIGGSQLEPHCDWRGMLQASVTGKTSLIVEGPVHCGGMDDNASVCTRCATFTFVPDELQQEPWSPVGKLMHLGDSLKDDGAPPEVWPNGTWGQDKRWCVSHIWEKHWMGIQTIDKGLGLIRCDWAETFQLNVHRLLRNDTFCNENEAGECLKILQPDLSMPTNFTWLPVHSHLELHAATVTPITAVQRVRRVIDLFWSCASCREHFLLAEFQGLQNITDAADAVMWLWRVHNNITMVKLKDNVQFGTGPQRFPPEIDLGAALWPSAALCPTCRRSSKSFKWAPTASTREVPTAPLSSIFDEDAVYHFLVDDFYASRNRVAKRKRNFTKETGSSWASWLPHFDRLRTSPLGHTPPGQKTPRISEGSTTSKVNASNDNKSTNINATSLVESWWSAPKQQQPQRLPAASFLLLCLPILFLVLRIFGVRHSDTAKISYLPVATCEPLAGQFQK
jgi:hypothetical protein